ncbi:MAG: NAD-dependent epimerase/dehydratase family protein [Planctomycetes bacterium]|nr:NAD-dependent epimerase/dehydratase family protein [Planctomycetota bacterium]
MPKHASSDRGPLRRVLITGGAGFIGSHLAASHVAAGDEVTILDDLSTGRRENVPEGARLVVADLRDAEAVCALVAEVRPEVVSHQAAQASVSVSLREPVRDAEINVIGGLHLLHACRDVGTVDVFVFASTGGAIYGEVPEGRLARVGDERHPDSPYAVHKAAFEDALRILGHGAVGRALVLRYANVYGPRQRGDGEAGVVAIFRDALEAGRPLKLFARAKPGDGGCIRDYVHVADVVRAHRSAVTDPSWPELVNVSTGIGTSTEELLHAIERVVGRKAAITQGPPRPGDLERSVLEPGPGFQPSVSLGEGLQQLA